MIYIIFIPWLFSPVARKCNGDTFQDLIVRVCRIQHITGYLRPEASQIGYFTLVSSNWINYVSHLGLQVANVDPKTLCDFNPCEEVGCLYDPAAHCITDFECNPSFFNLNGEMLPKCKGTFHMQSKREFSDLTNYIKHLSFHKQEPRN